MRPTAPRPMPTRSTWPMQTWPMQTGRCDGADADGADGVGGAGWAVPGLENGGGEGGAGEGGGLSRASAAALHEAAAAWEALRRTQARCYRALTALHASDAIAESGYRSLPRLLADHLRVDDTETTRLHRHARALTPTLSPTGTPIPAALPATATQVTAGVIGPGHVEVIRKTMNRLAAVAGLDPDTLATTETQLAELATTHTPAALAHAATAILALLDPDGAAPDDSSPPENELHYLRRRDGSLSGKFTYRDPAAAETLHTALSAATPPDETTALADDPDSGQGSGSGHAGRGHDAHAAQTLPARRAQAMLDLAAEALTRGLDTDDPAERPIPSDRSDPAAPSAPTPGRPHADPGSADPAGEDTTGRTANDGAADQPAEDPVTDRPGEPQPPPPSPPGRPPAPERPEIEGGERVALTVTLNYDTLRAALTDHPGPTPGLPPRLALLGENTWIRPETARRLACEAEIIPAVLGARGELLDLGRKNRLVSLALRRAVILRDRHCAHPGCRRRARKCQVHHIRHWADGGETCLENCVLLCAYHHTLVHHSGWQIHMIDGQPWFTPPTWLDPHRQPRHNRPWQLDERQVS